MSRRRSPMAQELDAVEVKISIYKAYFDLRMRVVGDERQRDEEWQAFIGNEALIELLKKREILKKITKRRKGAR